MESGITNLEKWDLAKQRIVSSSINQRKNDEINKMKIKHSGRNTSFQPAWETSILDKRKNKFIFKYILSFKHEL